MHFIKAPNIFFNRADLEKAIQRHCEQPKTQYKVSIRNQYPCICIGHQHFYIHRLLGEYYFGDLKGLSIHHRDEDKCNNARENLIAITNSEHTALHHKGKDFRSRDSITSSVIAMSNARRRKDINAEDVIEARKMGMTYDELAKKFHCGKSVIAKCLSAIDWT